MLGSFFTLVVVALCFLTFVFFIAQIKHDNSIMDIAWGMGFVILAVYSLFSYSSFLSVQVLITLLVTIWGFRLSLHIFIRKLGKGEDFRYQKFRKEWRGNVYINAFLRVFMLQGFLMIIISLPVILVNLSTFIGSLVFSYIGLTVWSFGFVFETLSDWQLSQFIKNPENKEKILTSGLWKYSRHPNYFGESMMWWGIYIVAFSVPYGFLTIVSPVLITYLLINVSGAPMLEEKYKDNKKYQDYAKNTPKFFPDFF